MWFFGVLVVYLCAVTTGHHVHIAMGALTVAVNPDNSLWLPTAWTAGLQHWLLASLFFFLLVSHLV
jgi:hypothetical protein|tara:strand:- start:218 stop:415 length:198 start_codon:yes stop_codon:yes gene_type:complete